MGGSASISTNKKLKSSGSKVANSSIINPDHASVNITYLYSNYISCPPNANNFFVPIHSIHPFIHYKFFRKLGENIESRQNVAIKEIHLDKLKKRQTEDVMNEVTILSQLNHNGIVHLYAVYSVPDKIFMIMDYLKGGELLNAICRREFYTEGDARQLMHQITAGLVYIHARKVIHRDIKPENLILESRTPSINGNHIKIIDFGFAMVDPSSTIASSSSSSVGSTASHWICGTPGYIAPEVLKDKSYSTQVDVWSLGVVMYILLSGVMPFSHTDPTKVLQGSFTFSSERFGKVSESAKDLISRMLEVDPKKRYTALDVFLHPWMKTIPRRKTIQSALQRAMTRGRDGRDLYHSIVEEVENSLGVFSEESGSLVDHELLIHPGHDTGQAVHEKDPPQIDSMGLLHSNPEPVVDPPSHLLSDRIQRGAVATETVYSEGRRRSSCNLSMEEYQALHKMIDGILMDRLSQDLAIVRKRMSSVHMIDKPIIGKQGHRHSFVQSEVSAVVVQKEESHSVIREGSHEDDTSGSEEKPGKWSSLIIHEDGENEVSSMVEDEGEDEVDDDEEEEEDDNDISHNLESIRQYNTISRLNLGMFFSSITSVATSVLNSPTGYRRQSNENVDIRKISGLANALTSSNSSNTMGLGEESSPTNSEKLIRSSSKSRRQSDGSLLKAKVEHHRLSDISHTSGTTTATSPSTVTASQVTSSLNGPRLMKGHSSSQGRMSDASNHDGNRRSSDASTRSSYRSSQKSDGMTSGWDVDSDEDDD